MEREEIEKEYKWNLSDIYKNYDIWNKDFDKVKKLKEELISYKGTFSIEEKLLK